VLIACGEREYSGMATVCKAYIIIILVIYVHFCITVPYAIVLECSLLLSLGPTLLYFIHQIQ
jgi:hypothetical protein